LRNDTSCSTVKPFTYYDFGSTRIRVMAAGSGDGDANSQSMILKIEHWRRDGTVRSALLTGDSDATPWPDLIRFYGVGLQSNFLLGGHHGSDTFFRFGDQEDVYLHHIRHILPDVTVLSVGDDNPFGHPDPVAVRHYETWSRGGDRGMKLFRTDRHGSIRVV